MRELPVPDEWRDRVAVVTDVTEQDQAIWLSDEERRRAEKFRLERRRAEWSAARIAARILAQRIGAVTHAAELEIGMRDQCPWAKCDGGELSLSFTHSGMAGAAAMDAKPIGVDLERPRRVETGSARFFLNEQEMQLLELPVVDVLVHLWSAKEAAFKAARHARLLRQVRFSSIERDATGMSGRWTDGRNVGRISTRRIDDGFILALATSTD